MLKREILVPTGPQSWTAFTSVLTSLLISLLAVGFSEALVAQTGSLNISTPEQIAADAKSVPCSSKDRLDAVVRLFDRMGAAAGTVSIEKFKGGIENVVVRKPSNGKELVVVGAHYDKTPAGCGAVDNWSGIVTIGHVYRAVRDTPLQKTVVFVAFGKEEEGLRGSRAMVKGISKDEISQYCAMINIDSLGLGAPQVDDTVTAKKLMNLASRLAKEMKIPYAHAPIRFGTSDGASFQEKKIPSILIHGLTNEWRTVLHTGRDLPEIVNSTSVYLGYRLVLALLMSVDAGSCDSWK